jgi:hypothetical protein
VTSFACTGIGTTIALSGAAPRDDGRFDMAVNGGPVLTVECQKTPYLPAQRQVEVPWQGHAFAPDVVLSALDPEVTAVTFPPSAALVAAGSAMTDASGERCCSSRPQPRPRSSPPTASPRTCRTLRPW